MAKQIEPINVWVNGEVKVAEFLDSYGIGLTLGVSARFFYSLFTKVVDAEGVESPGQIVTSGNLDMTGADYQAWEQDDYAWEWVAEKLNLEIV